MSNEIKITRAAVLRIEAKHAVGAGSPAVQRFVAQRGPVRCRRRPWRHTLRRLQAVPERIDPREMLNANHPIPMAC